MKPLILFIAVISTLSHASNIGTKVHFLELRTSSSEKIFPIISSILEDSGDLIDQSLRDNLGRADQFNFGLGFKREKLRIDADIYARVLSSNPVFPELRLEAFYGASIEYAWSFRDDKRFSWRIHPRINLGNLHFFEGASTVFIDDIRPDKYFVNFYEIEMGFEYQHLKTLQLWGALNPMLIFSSGDTSSAQSIGGALGGRGDYQALRGRFVACVALGSEELSCLYNRKRSYHRMINKIVGSSAIESIKLTTGLEYSFRSHDVGVALWNKSYEFNYRLNISDSFLMALIYSNESLASPYQELRLWDFSVQLRANF